MPFFQSSCTVVRVGSQRRLSTEELAGTVVLKSPEFLGLVEDQTRQS